MNIEDSIEKVTTALVLGFIIFALIKAARDLLNYFVI